MSRHHLLAPVIGFVLAGCVGFFGGERAIKTYPRPAKETLVALNQALRDLNFFPADLVPSQPYPRLTYVTTAYREQSLGEIVYIAVRDMGGERSQVEILTEGDVTGVWTWTVWWPALIFEQTDRRLLSAGMPQPGSMPPPLAPRL